jgi:hypothetical protein
MREFKHPFFDHIRVKQFAPAGQHRRLTSAVWRNAAGSRFPLPQRPGASGDNVRARDRMGVRKETNFHPKNIDSPRVVLHYMGSKNR